MREYLSANKLYMSSLEDKIQELKLYNSIEEKQNQYLKKDLVKLQMELDKEKEANLILVDELIERDKTHAEDCLNSDEKLNNYSKIMVENDKQINALRSELKNTKKLMHIYAKLNDFKNMTCKELEKRIVEKEDQLRSELVEKNSLIKTLEKDTMCPVCHDDMKSDDNKLPMVNKCGHIFCSVCIHAMDKCAICRYEYDESHHVRLFF